MLHEKLEQASKDAGRSQQKYMLIALALALIVGLVIVNMTLLQERPFHDKQEPEFTSVESPGNQSVEALTPATALTVDEKTAEPPFVAEMDGEREFFKSSVKKFERELEPQIASNAFKVWNVDAQHRIMTMKKEAISLFSNAEYTQANTVLSQAESLTNTELAARDVAYQKSLDMATAAHKIDDYDVALINITEALKLKPEASEAILLKTKVDKLPALAELLEKVRIASIENNYTSELGYLKEILVLDPSRKNLKKRADELEQTIKENRFQKHISKGLADVARQDLEKARQNLSNAKLLFPGSQEVSLLLAKVTNLGEELETERLINEAIRESATDNWRAALDLYAGAKKIQPENQVAIEGYILAKRIVTVQGAISKHLSALHRLSSSNVSALAHDVVNQSRPLKGVSPILDAMTGELAHQLAVYGIKVPVRVVSDGETIIAVRGVGNVGVVLEKVIQLKPGQYSVEGKRAGFKSVLVQVDVPPGSDGIEIRVVCNEQI